MCLFGRTSTLKTEVACASERRHPLTNRTTEGEQPLSNTYKQEDALHLYRTKHNIHNNFTTVIHDIKKIHHLPAENRH
jgi:hypothetical protein